MNQTEFIDLYNSDLTMAEIVEKTGSTYAAVTKRASRLRTAGHEIKYHYPPKEHFERIGAIGGKNGTTGGFFANRELARTAGAIGGKAKRRRNEK